MRVLNIAEVKKCTDVRMYARIQTYTCTQAEIHVCKDV